MRGACSIGFVVLALALLASCSSPSHSTSNASAPPAATPPPAYDSATARRVTRHLWPDMKEWLRGDPASADTRVAMVQAARPGSPVPVSQDYAMTEPILARWLLPDDVHSVSAGMYDHMCPTPTSATCFFVPVSSRGRPVAEMDVQENSHGRWEVVEMVEGPGQAAAYQAAAATLRQVLGEGADVRPVLFLPSGLEFAVGHNLAREAAVYLTFVNYGSGVGSFDKYLPKTGRLFTPPQLQRLLSP